MVLNSIYHGRKDIAVLYINSAQIVLQGTNKKAFCVGPWLFVRNLRFNH